MFGFRYAPADAAVETLATPLPIRRANHTDRQLFPPRRQAASGTPGAAFTALNFPALDESSVCAPRIPNSAGGTARTQPALVWVDALRSQQAG
jgi:hypothetical protein